MDDSKIETVRERLSKPDVLADRVQRILNSNFVKMTYPVLTALMDSATDFNKETISKEVRNSIVDGHVIAIDLSEPMDRIMDADEDIEFLDDYKTNESLYFGNSKAKNRCWRRCRIEGI